MKHKKTTHQPLNDAELEMLENLLYALADTVDAVDVDVRPPLMLDAVDGLFAALALSPSMTPIAEWMSWVFGDAQFADKTQTQTLRNLLIRHQDSVVYHFRKTDLSQYTPCIATFEDDETFDVSHWCAGFTLGFEAKQSLWADKMDEPAWTDVHAVMALKEADETGRVSVHEDLDADERALRLHQDTLVELMRREISAMLEEPVDNLTLLLFVLADLQEVMLTQQAKSRSSR